MHDLDWRLLISAPASGASNMALDQALLEQYHATQQPTLRLYGWSPPCVSIGLGQRLARDVDLIACAARGIDVVRRATGGRAILHDQEVTYALVIAVDHPMIGRGSIVDAYRTISEALCCGLDQIGVTPELAPRPAADAARSAACFDLPGDYEITVRGRKLVGSAQARKHGVLLQHGSILLHADADQLAAVLYLPDDLDGSLLSQRLIALDEVLGYGPSFDQISPAIVAGFEQHWRVRFTPGDLTTDEQRRATELVAQKYGNAQWTRRR